MTPNASERAMSFPTVRSTTPRRVPINRSALVVDNAFVSKRECAWMISANTSSGSGYTNQRRRFTNVTLCIPVLALPLIRESKTWRILAPKARVAPTPPVALSCAQTSLSKGIFERLGPAGMAVSGIRQVVAIASVRHGLIAAVHYHY